MELNHRFLGVDQASLPLDHGTVESPGIAPGFSACRADVVLLDHDPERKPWDSNPQTALRRHLFSRQAPHPAGWLPL
jgi:hypothetical protein